MRKHIIFLIVAIACTLPFLVYSHAEHSIPTTYTVQPKDTLWSIAASHYPQKDTRKVVWEIEQLNHINNVIQVGQEIVLP